MASVNHHQHQPKSLAGKTVECNFLTFRHVFDHGPDHMSHFLFFPILATEEVTRNKYFQADVANLGFC